MSKKRPSREPVTGALSSSIPFAKSDPGYWTGRIFRNTYTVGGELRRTRNWCVKIQHLGVRRTVALLAGDRAQAAVEACRLYCAVRKQGWDEIDPSRSPEGQPPSNGSSELERPLHAGYWEQRLVRREYAMSAEPRALRELSVHIEHQGRGHFFLLGTADRAEAAARALRIYRTVSGRGWETASERFSRELTIAFRWMDKPLAWTYTTIHTHNRGGKETAPGASVTRRNPRRVAVVESDAGVQQALAWCVNQMDGYSCQWTFRTAVDALRALPKSPVCLVLIGSSLAGQPGAACLQELQRSAPAVAGLLYSVYEDSEELFRSTPGGATNYLLQRTASTAFLAPLAGVREAGKTFGEAAFPAVWRYFKNAFSLSSLGDFARPASNLTPREHEVFTALSKGSPDKDIAYRLRISIHTVHEHVRNIFEKLGVHNRTEAVVKFLQK